MDEPVAKEFHVADKGNDVRGTQTARMDGIPASVLNKPPDTGRFGDQTANGDEFSNYILRLPSAPDLDFDQINRKSRSQLTILPASPIKRPDRVRHLSGRARCAARGSLRRKMPAILKDRRIPAAP
jgi:hypothetical protein